MSARLSPACRERVFTEFGTVCMYCCVVLPADCMEIDHFIPGFEKILFPACPGCNKSKGDRMPCVWRDDEDFIGMELTAEFLSWVGERRARLAPEQRKEGELLAATHWLEKEAQHA